MKKAKITESVLFDGTQKELYTKEFKIETETDNLSFTVESFSKNYLSNFDKNTVLNEILKVGEYTKVDDEYFTEEEMMLYYLEKNQYLLILSYGEFQPSRFVVNLESVWKIG